MWGADGRPADTKCLIPESTFARIYQEIINFCKTNGAFDPRTMGTVPNVGLMAQKAKEYGSHDKTYESPQDGTARIVDNATGEVLESLQMPVGVGVSGLESDGGDRFFCGGGSSGKITAIRRPKSRTGSP